MSHPKQPLEAKDFAKFLASLRLTLWLLFALAVFSALGTAGLVPQNLPPDEYTKNFGFLGQVILLLGWDNYFQSFLMRGLYLALSLNLALCVYARSLFGIKNALGDADPSVSEKLGDRSALIDRLRAGGFLVTSENPVRAQKRRLAFLAFPLVHVAPFMIFVGAFVGTWAGFIGTKNIHVGTVTEAVMDWSVKKEIQLPFAIKVDDFDVEYFRPLRVRFKALAGPGREVELSSLEGTEVSVDGTGYKAVVESFDPKTSDMVYYIIAQGQRLGPFSKGREAGAPLLLRPLAFKGDEKRPEAALSLYSVANPGAAPKTFKVSVNNPAFWEGYKIYLIAWGNDIEGRPFVGLQVVEDPGEWLMWVGAVLLSAGILALLFLDGAWVREEDGRVVGRASRGKKSLRLLLKEGGEGEDS